ncbi:uncharacterized protein BXZ73DRAFT_110875 [Epithele typhae]|uniref:uncharacterized protein n=1 Tax=Epithele typhae TaxID=378194 RepID=UPI002008C7B9|nr:uncharacterized protein BXZ73DRAFT_110875 [Epithele typhae]KAH9905529.1 hypothetical protein BXZ73DRAFT_110875 [Epithele typhae]
MELGETMLGYWKEWYERATLGTYSEEFPAYDVAIPFQGRYGSDVRAPPSDPDGAVVQHVPDLRKILITNSRMLVSRKRGRNMFDLASSWKKQVLQKMDEAETSAFGKPKTYTTTSLAGRPRARSFDYAEWEAKMKRPKQSLPRAAESDSEDDLVVLPPGLDVPHRRAGSDTCKGLGLNRTSHPFGTERATFSPYRMRSKLLFASSSMKIHLLSHSDRDNPNS